MAATPALIAAVSSSTALLTGLTILSIGLLLISLSLLAFSWLRHSALRRAAYETHRKVSSDVSLALGPELKLDDLRLAVDGARNDLFRGGTREDVRRRVAMARERLSMEQPRMERMSPAYSAAMNLATDELVFLEDREDSDIAALVAYFKAAERLEDAIAETRLDWEM